MPTVDITVTCPVFDSFRARQVAGMFDVPLTEKATAKFCLELPELGEDWRLGMIVGPSGSGKSTIARHLFGKHLYRPRPWAEDRAVIDGLGERPIKEITALFTAVGFGSPPSWIKPYQVLSTGEQFRCELARALAEAAIPTLEPLAIAVENDCDSLPAATSAARAGRPDGWPLVVFDEFTSVVDRQVARVCAAAIAKAIRQGHLRCRFVAVTCHYDVMEWLAPDWVIDMATVSFQRRYLRRPPVHLAIVRCRRSAWRLFARHHYLSGQLSPISQCFLALWNEEPVAFCATVALAGFRGRRRISRLVTLPDYQGIGIGTALLETVAELHRGEGKRVNITASHPAVIAHCRRSRRWRAVGVRRTGGRQGSGLPGYRSAAGRAVASFEFQG
jgi:GNAT superfamily N-acetyltransferase